MHKQLVHESSVVRICMLTAAVYSSLTAMSYFIAKRCAFFFLVVSPLLINVTC